jgi:hypothetical protein
VPEVRRVGRVAAAVPGAAHARAAVPGAALVVGTAAHGLLLVGKRPCKLPPPEVLLQLVDVLGARPPPTAAALRPRGRRAVGRRRSDPRRAALQLAR